MAHEFTTEERRRGSYARAAKLAEHKAKDAQRIEDAWRERLDKMFEAIDEILDQRDDLATLCRAILAGQDRLAGKPVQPTEHSGSIDHTHTAVEAREHLANRVVGRIAAGGENGDPRGVDG
jgi:hypothetical protein